MKIDTTTCSPWAEIHARLSNMRSLTVKVGNEVYEGPADIETVDGHVTLTFPAKPAPKAKPAAKKASK